jgi:DNA-binding XRE family transcriptional regulator/quercetin dioxygenase-like cupin family protein
VEQPLGRDEFAAALRSPIGQRLRQARVERGMSVRGLARAIDVSPSLISQIETGKSSTSVSTLYAITTALKVSIEDVFGDPTESTADRAATGAMAPIPAVVPTVVPAGTNAPNADSGAPPGSWTVQQHGPRTLANQRRVGPVVRAPDCEALQLESGVAWELLGRLPHSHVEFLRITYAPGGSSSGGGVLMRHSGTEFGHVLSGRLTLVLGFDTYELDPGDSVSFDCATPHAYANHGTEPAIGVWWVLERFG